MKSAFSESTYAFSLTHEYVGWHHSGITACPVFPSLYEEGQKGGGYDVKIKRPNTLPTRPYPLRPDTLPKWLHELLSQPYTLLYLQFKLSERMRQRNAREAQSGKISVPYYRMKLLPNKNFNQHKLLRKLDNKKPRRSMVFYVAPKFRSRKKIKKYFGKKEICKHSFWVRPSIIDKLSVGQAHTVAFKSGRTPYVFSKPRPLDTSGTFEEFENSIVRTLGSQSQDEPRPNVLEDTATYISEIIKKELYQSDSEPNIFHGEKLEGHHPLYQIAFYSQFFLGSQLFIVNKKIDEKILREKAG